VYLKAEAPLVAGEKATDQYLKPEGYGSDNLINQEIGLKSEWLEHRLQANVSLYRMNWSNVQILLFDPTHLGNTQFAVNGPTYVVKGLELQLVGRVTEGLTIQGSSSWNSSNQTNAPCLQAKIATAAGAAVGSCITTIGGQPYTNPFGVLNTSPAYSPPLQFNLRARYDMTFADYKPFVSVGAQHVASMRNEPASYVSGNLAAPEGCLVNGTPNTTLCAYEMPGYTTYDASIGVAKDTWTVQLIGNNITNSDASTNTNSGQFIKEEVPLRPRVLTLSFGYKF
jgi:outer membrane receptor protein involved in Fe transport